MAYPDKYTRQFDFQAFQNANPNRPLPGDKVNADLNLAEISIGEIVEFLKTSLRSDGAIMNGAVGYDQLDTTLQSAGLAPLTAWAPSTAYVVSRITINAGSLYVCLFAHTSSAVFTNDFAAGYWEFIAELPSGEDGTDGRDAWLPVVEWLTATAYVAGPPASVVTHGGESYVCLVAHTSGIFATDLAASKWILIAAKGVDGAVAIAGTPTVNQFANWTDATTIKGTSITGLVKGNGASAPTAAVAGTDYLAPDAIGVTVQGYDADLATLSSLGNWKVVYSNGSGAVVALTVGADATLLAGNGVTSAPSFRTVDSVGGVVKAGNQNLTGGFTATSNGITTVTGSNQTITANPLSGNIQDVTLNGSSLTGTLSFVVPSSPCSIVLELVNGGSGAVGATLGAGSFTKADITAYNTTNGNKFLVQIIKTKTYSYLSITALQ